MKSRADNAFRNAVVGILCQMAVIICSFISRTVFIYRLGADYLGVNGLFTNVLGILSLGELGLANVVLFRLYGPISRGDSVLLNSLIKYFGKLYRIMAIGVLGIGLLLVPFLPFIVNSTLEQRHLNLYYILFLLNSVSSYIAAHKSAMFNANQRLYMVNILRSGFLILQHLLQMVALVITQNYYLYLIMQVVCTLLSNIVLTFYADRVYPFLLSGETVPIEKSKIWDNLKSSFLYRAGTIILNNTDNIFISVLVGTVYVGYYTNYLMFFNVATTVIQILTNAFAGGLGNLNTTGDRARSYQIFNVLILGFHLISALCSVCFWISLNDVIQIWVGREYILARHIVTVIILQFYIRNAANPIWMYRESLGLFHQIKYLMLVAALINIVLSLALGIVFAMAGIIIATVISMLLTVMWYEPRILFSQIFQQSPIQYLLRQLRYVLCTVIAAALSYLICSHFPVSILFICLKLAITSCVVILCFLLFNYKMPETRYALEYLQNVLKRLHQRLKGAV